MKFISLKQTSKDRDPVIASKQNSESASKLTVTVFILIIMQTFILISLLTPDNYSSIRIATSTIVTYEKRVTDLQDSLFALVPSVKRAAYQCETEVKNKTISAIMTDINQCDVYLQKVYPQLPAESEIIYDQFEKTFAALKFAKDARRAFEDYALTNNLPEDTPFSNFPTYGSVSFADFQQKQLEDKTLLFFNYKFSLVIAVYLVPFLLALYIANIAYLLWHITFAINTNVAIFKGEKLFSQIKILGGKFTPTFFIFTQFITLSAVLTVFLLLPGESLFLNLQPELGFFILTLHFLAGIIGLFIAVRLLSLVNKVDKYEGEK